MSAADHLPSAAEVLREGLALARGVTSGPHDIERARLLLDYARELREGSSAETRPDGTVTAMNDDTFMMPRSTRHTAFAEQLGEQHFQRHDR